MKDKIKILVVDDNFLNQKLVSFMLNDWGFEYDLCSNGKLAIEKLKLNRYDLILMDIQMPEMDGYEATKFIRQDMKLGLPIIAMTAQVFEGEMEKCLSKGMSNYITKPIKELELYMLIVSSLYLDLETV